MKRILLSVFVVASPCFAWQTEINRDETHVSGANEVAGSHEVIRIANENRDIVGAAAGAAIGGGGVKEIAGAVAGAIIARDPNRK